MEWQHKAGNNFNSFQCWGVRNSSRGNPLVLPTRCSSPVSTLLQLWSVIEAGARNKNWSGNSANAMWTEGMWMWMWMWMGGRRAGMGYMNVECGGRSVNGACEWWIEQPEMHCFTSNFILVFIMRRSVRRASMAGQKRHLINAKVIKNN